MNEYPAVYSESTEVPIVFRFIWFVLAGLWLGGILTGVAWFFCVTIIGLPVGLWLFDRVPLVMTLKAPSTETRVVVRDGYYHVKRGDADQIPLLLRLLWLVLAGWWLSALWLSLAYLASATIIGLPVAFWMYNRVPKVLWLTEV